MMGSKAVYSSIAFTAALLMHAGFKLWQETGCSDGCTQGASIAELLAMYVSRGDIFIGLSYACAAAFTVYSFLVFLAHPRTGTCGFLGGVTLTGLLYFGGCFLIGCCGSPMLPIYLGLLGSSLLGLEKPIILGVTLVSVGVGFWWTKSRRRTPCR